MEEAEFFGVEVEMEELLKERWRTNVEEWRASDAVDSGVTQKAASGPETPKAEAGHSDLLEVDVNWKGTWENQSSVCSLEDSQKKRRAVMRRESAVPRDHVSGQDICEDDNKSSKELSFVPSAGGWPPRFDLVRDHKCSERRFRFYDVAVIVVEEGDTPHTTHLCRNWYDCREIRAR